MHPQILKNCEKNVGADWLECSTLSHKLFLFFSVGHISPIVSNRVTEVCVGKSF
jgi:hypothetical protein